MKISLPCSVHQSGTLVVLVTGGRNFSDDYMLFEALDEVEALCDARELVMVIVEGGAPGTDRLAGQWALLNNKQVIIERARWDLHGKAAGPRRNQAMIDKYHPDICIAMPGGTGTSDMVARCQAADIPVFQDIDGEER